MLLLLFIISYYCIAKSVEWNTDGTVYNTININEDKRGFLLYHPSGGNPNKEYQLWVLLHGQSRNAITFAENTDFFMVARDKEVIAVFPEGHCDDVFESMCCWNTGHLRGLTQKDWSLDDIAFLDKLLSQIKDTYTVSEIIVVGFSAGAFMTYTYAINTTEHDIFAIFPIAGHIGGNSSQFHVPVINYDPNRFGVQSEYRPHVISIGGSDDINVKIEGGLTFDRRIDFSKKQDMDFWMEANNCINRHISFNYYFLNDQVKLSYYGEECEKLVGFITVMGVGHAIRPYDKVFLKGRRAFTEYTKTLMEFLYNFVEYEIKKVNIPSKDPDPIPPTDGDYKWIIFTNNGSYLTFYCCIFITIICFLF